ncbi:MAG TPA: pyruvate kinase [Bryobacteraceae bacterium]
MSTLGELEFTLSSVSEHTSKPLRRTKIVATIGPASSSPDVIRQLILAGMDVARLNFSHGAYEDHARTISLIRALSNELDTPITILQDLQGPKVRVGRLPGNQLKIEKGESVALIPECDFDGQPATIPLDYPDAASEAEIGTPVLMADGLFELRVESIRGKALQARVVQGGVLTSRKGVNFPTMDLRLPAMTAKDEQDLAFGLAQGVDAISLSFVRSARDVQFLKKLIAAKGVRTPVIAKIEKPQAVAHLNEILAETQGVMVARGDLGVEVSVEKVPMLQKHIIEQCNRRRLPVITATQMLDSMIHEPRPTRAEASDVANAIIDGTDAVMLSGESAVGAWPVKAVETMARIAAEVESAVEFRSYEISGEAESQALSKAAAALTQYVNPKCIVVFAGTALIAVTVAAERPKALVVALTTEPRIYHALNLVWGVRPLLVEEMPKKAEDMVEMAATTVLRRGIAVNGDKVLVLAGISAGEPHAANFIKVHVIGSAAD